MPRKRQDRRTLSLKALDAEGVPAPTLVKHMVRKQQPKPEPDPVGQYFTF
jgi:hypothetical protein